MTSTATASPFLSVDSFVVNESPVPRPVAAGFTSRSPFLSVYEFEGHVFEAPHDNPVREAFATLVDELHDEEFDEALDELEVQARGLYDNQLAQGVSRDEAERMVGQHFAGLIRESEAVLDAAARQFGPRDEASIVESEFDEFFDSYAPSAPLEPEFEDFLKKWAKKAGNFVKKAASKAWKGIKSLAIGPILRQLRKVIRPLLERVLKRAIGKLPEPLRPLAQKLAERLGLARPATTAAPDASSAEPSADASGAAADVATTPSSAVAGPQEPVGADGPTPQQELDEVMASALLAQDEDELNLEVAQLMEASEGAPVFSELDEARERFVQGLANLREGESSEPLIQEFLPALMPALRLGIRVAGRQNVIRFLAGLLSKLIARLVGPQNAPTLSRAIVDAGMKALSLEAPEGEESLASSTVAATVEEAAARVAALPDYVLENEELLEGFVLEAFEQAAAANLPSILSEATYRRRPDLLEGGVNAGWVLLPLIGPKRYKRCTKAFHVRLSPYLTEEVETFEAAPLAEFLEEALGIPEGEEFEAEVHLYEALPGTRLADIARGEREQFGPSLSDEANAEQLHPLTPQAAAALLGRPALGRAAGVDPRRLASGQRLYRLAIAGRRMLAAPASHPSSHRGPRPRRRFHLNATLDCVQDQIRVCAFLSESKAQKLAVQMRQQTNLGVVAAAFRKAVAWRLARAFAGVAPRRLRIVHSSMPPGQIAAHALGHVPRAAAGALAVKVQEWLVKGFADFLRTQAQPLLAAAQDPAEGVTLRFSIDKPPGLKEFGQAAVAKGVAANVLLRAIGAPGTPAVRVAVESGHRCA